MRKMKYMLLAALLVLGSFSSLFAVEETLIDFSQYEAKLAQDGVYAKERGTRKDLDENMIPRFNITVDDMKIEKWIVELNSSAKSVQAKLYSMTKAVETKGLVGAKRTVLGARVHFPEWSFSAWAKIAPPFEFPTYKADGSFANVNNGLVKNTGQIYQISVEVNGRNYNNALILKLKNEYDIEEEYFMGYLFFQGWRRLIWKNPHYISNVDLREIMRLPLYPKSVPYKKLSSFVIYRHGDQWGGDFVVYIANVKVAYDLAVLEEETDVDDEKYWKIISTKAKAKAERQRKLNAELLSLRLREKAKMHKGADKKGTQEEANKTNNTTNNTKPANNQPQQ